MYKMHLQLQTTGEQQESHEHWLGFAGSIRFFMQRVSFNVATFASLLIMPQVQDYWGNIKACIINMNVQGEHAWQQIHMMSTAAELSVDIDPSPKIHETWNSGCSQFGPTFG